jgi:uncharacterized membrane protein
METSEYSLIERLIGYAILGFVGTLGIVAAILAPILVVLKIMETPLMNFVVGGGTIVVLLTLGYLYSCFLKYIERKGAEKYRKQYQKEQAEMAQNWITRGVTTVEWPYIPDEEVKSIVKEYAQAHDYGMDDSFSFSAVLERLKENIYSTTEEHEDEAKEDYLLAFMNRYNLRKEDTIKYWW